MTALAPLSTQLGALDQVLARLKDGSRTFARLNIDERICLLDSMREGMGRVSQGMVTAACLAKGIDPDSALAGEEWMAGPMVTARNLRLTAQALREVKSHGAPRVDSKWLRTLPDGRLAVRVFPNSALDAVLLAKHKAEVHMQPGVTANNLKEHQANFYAKPHGGKVCLVLGGGNVNSIAPTDVAYKMFVEGKACVLKMNPVNAYLGPFLEQAFARAIERGFLAVVYGGAEEGAYLVQHAVVDEVHITGSDKTHDAMVWGAPGPEREARKLRKDPLLKKEISSELGNVSPVIVVPALFEADALVFQGKNIAGMVSNNASFNCVSAKLLVTHQGWSQRGALVEQVAQGLGRAAVRKAYYPGAEERWKKLVEGRAGVRQIGTAGPGQLPFALLKDVDPTKLDDRVFTQEPWCSVLSETALPAADARSFLREAVRFVNEHVWGTLCATLVVHPSTMADPASAAAVEEAIRALRYGSVCVNTWPGALFGIGTAPWGAHPSSSPENIQSGRGWVHNTLMLEDIEKCVMEAPLTTFPVPPWSPGHRSLDVMMKKLLSFETDPTWLKLPGIAAAAIRA